MKKICVITGTRAEYGLFSHLMRLIKEDDDCSLQIIATNMHLLEQYGCTYKEIEADGFMIDEKVAMPDGNGAGEILHAMAVELDGMTQALQRLQPDCVVILGDRYEMLMAATAAMMLRIPIAHIHGGETTEGAIDDSIRHSITQMSSLHFASTPQYAARIVQMGKPASSVYYVGALGVENILTIPLMQADELSASLDGFIVDHDTLLATYHPATLESQPQLQLIGEFLDALSCFPNLKVLFTMPNSDEGSQEISKAIADYCAAQPRRCRAFKSLGLRRYLSALHLCGAVVGNSSSGIIEAPSAGVGTLDIGIRQRGRAHGPSVLHCSTSKADIVAGITQVLSPEHRAIAARCENPYSKSGTARSILLHIKDFL